MRYAPLRLRVPLFYRLYSKSASKRPDLFTEAPLELAPNVRLTLVPTDVAHGPMAWAGVYELELSQRMQKLGTRGGILIDVGANYGYFSCLWAAQNAANRIVAFEASPRNAAGLRHNVTSNGFEGQVEIVPCAAGREAGTMSFDVGPADQTGWGHLKQGGDGPSVEIVTLDTYCAEASIEQVAVLKVDVEGADAWVLQGASRMIREQRIGTVFFEEDDLHMERLGIEPGSCSALLRAAGYHVEMLAPEEFVATRPT